MSELIVFARVVALIAGIPLVALAVVAGIRWARGFDASVSMDFDEEQP